MNVITELKRRGLLNQASTEKLDEYLQSRPRKAYLGLDPTADSLHVGNLVPIMAMRHLSDAGHDIILLVGGGTGMIGDPSGKSDERNLLDDKTLLKNRKALAKQVRHLLAGKKFQLVDNATWLHGVKLLEFLRDIGKHFTVNSMIKRDAVRPRLETPDQSISYTEFSYLLLQAYDYLHLNQKYKADLQVGGADQWGNIVSGVELIRRKTGKEVAAFTTPLVTDKTTGKKFGKSEGNAIWLDPAKTSPYAFYQFWLNVADPNVFDYLKIFTLLPVGDIEVFEKKDDSQEKYQRGKQLLAYEMTKLVHGLTNAERVKAVSELLFGSRELSSLSKQECEILKTAAPTITVSKLSVTKGELAITDVLVESKLASSRTEARSLLEQGAISINGDRVSTQDAKLHSQHFINNIALLRRGKKQFACISL